MYFSIRGVFSLKPEVYNGAAQKKKELLSSLVNGTEEEFNKILKEFNDSMNEANRDPEMMISDKKYILLYTWLQVIPVLMSHNVDEKEFNGAHLKFYYDLETMEDISDISVINTAFFQSARNYYKNSNVTIEYSPFTLDCMKYIENHIYDDFDLEDLAKQLHYNSYYLSKKFKKEKGISISQYVLECKINEARLLLEKKQSIKHISDLLCFSSQSYFTECFKKSLGITPKQYQYLIKK